MDHSNDMLYELLMKRDARRNGADSNVKEDTPSIIERTRTMCQIHADEPCRFL
jgi:hypothetical protein